MYTDADMQHINLMKMLDQVLKQLAALSSEVALLREQADEIVEKINNLSEDDMSVAYGSSKWNE